MNSSSDSYTLENCRWLSPETLKNGVYSTKTDVYSFSIMVWEIFSFGQLPFYKYNNKVLRTMIIEKKAVLPKCLSEIPPDMNALRLRCMDPDPDKRPDFFEIEDIISKMDTVVKPQPPSFLSKMVTGIREDRRNYSAYEISRNEISKKTSSTT
ncbi:unnamed protein product [Angiostrongylus costaricensis]|uniref:Protein kinase domain-containing protein n=1 Tax=Angiostrongylus costaricensis TaxID=334426 RepID=A0A0R3PVK8_ANGCS|nr:unnamed protein product [Angiostrongylus costaricensis]